MQNIKIILKSLWNKKISTLFMIIQLTITIVILLSSFILANSTNYLANQAKSKNIDLKNTIHFKIYNASFSDDFKKKYNELENYINNISGIKNFGAFDFSNTLFLELENNKKYLDIRKIDLKGTFKDKYTSSSEMLMIDKGIYEILKPNIAKGRGLKDNDFYKNDQDATPILAGDRYKTVLNIGQILTNADNNSKYVIIGFLKKNSNWFNEQDYISNMLTSLDNKFVIPYKNSEQIANINVMAKSNAVFFSVDNNQEIGHIKSIINNKAKSLNLKVKSSSIEEELKEFKAMIKEILNSNLFLAIFLILLSCLGISTVMVSSILNRKREFGIRISTGASIKYIRNLVIGEVSFIAIISSVISVVFVFYNQFKANKFLRESDIPINPMENISLESLVFVVVIVVLIILVTTFVPLKKLKKLQAKDLIGGID